MLLVIELLSRILALELSLPGTRGLLVLVGGRGTAVGGAWGLSWGKRFHTSDFTSTKNVINWSIKTETTFSYWPLWVWKEKRWQGFTTGNTQVEKIHLFKNSWVVRLCSRTHPLRQACGERWWEGRPGSLLFHGGSILSQQDRSYWKPLSTEWREETILLLLHFF